MPVFRNPAFPVAPTRLLGRLSCIAAALHVLVACSGASSPAAAAATTDAAPTRKQVTTELAVTDCAAAAGLFGDALQGLTLDTAQQSDPEAGLQCTWRTLDEAVPARLRSLILQVYLGADLEEKMFDAQALSMSGMTRVAAPAFEQRRGLAFSQVSSTPAGRGGQFHAQLPDAHVLVQTMHGSEAAGRPLDDASAVSVAGQLLGLQ